MRLVAFLFALFLGLPQAFALMPLPIPASDAAQTVRAFCADSHTTDDQRSEIISRSLEDAVACMGEDWVYGDLEALNVSTDSREVDVDVDARRMRFIDASGKLQVWLTSPGIGGVTKTQCRNCTATLIGEFQGPYRTEDGSYRVQDESKDYIGAPMPWAVFYAEKTGWAIHGTPYTGQLGLPASHGCIRIATANARFFNAWVNLANDASLKINVHGTGVATISPPRPRVRRAPAPEVYAPAPRSEDDYYYGAPRPPMGIPGGYYRPYGW